MLFSCHLNVNLLLLLCNFHVTVMFLNLVINIYKNLIFFKFFPDKNFRVWKVKMYSFGLRIDVPNVNVLRCRSMILHSCRLLVHSHMPIVTNINKCCSINNIMIFIIKVRFYLINISNNFK